MITLSQASYDTKEILKWGGLFIAGLVILVLGFVFIKQTFFPTPPPKPTMDYGKLTPQLFPKNVIDKTPTFVINTLSGALPNFPDLIKIYKIQVNTPNLLGVDNATAMAKALKFTLGPNKISETLYEWKNPDDSDLASKIDIDIVNFNFNISTNYLTNNTIATSQNMQAAKDSIIDAKKILSSLSISPNDLDDTKTQTEFLNIKNGVLTAADSLSNAQVTKVLFYQNDINKLPIFYENPNSSNITMLIGPQDKTLEVNYVHQIVTDKFATYPLKTSTQAYEDLKQGYSYIASYQGKSSTVSINDVTLAYYIGSQPQEFLMPVFVFQGNDNFVAYVPAVTDEWISK
jgi:hypothetical protein